MAFRFLRSLRLALLPLVPLAVLGSACGAQETIPVLHGVSLDGTNVTLPDPGGRTPSLLIVGFSQKSTDESTLWGKRVYRLLPRTSLAVYTTPVLQDVPKLLRGVVLHEMRKSIPPTVQPWFVPILDHEAEWKQVSHFDKPDEAYILLIDARGRVRWRTTGAVDDARIAELEKELKALGG